MELVGPLSLLILGIVVLALVAGVVILLKLGVITRYAFREELPDRGSYDLGQSHEAGDDQESGLNTPT